MARYVYKDRRYELAAEGGRWVIATGRPGEPPVRQPFADRVAAQAAWSRMLANTLVCHPEPLLWAQINGATVVLVADVDGRVHLGERGGLAGDFAAAFEDQGWAVEVWRERCIELVRAAEPGVVLGPLPGSVPGVLPGSVPNELPGELPGEVTGASGAPGAVPGPAAGW